MHVLMEESPLTVSQNLGNTAEHISLTDTASADLHFSLMRNTFIFMKYFDR